MDERRQVDPDHEGREQYDMDVDRMINEGLGGGTVTIHNGLIEETSVDTMPNERVEDES
ncbi:hypothetical protein [Paenibacillus sp. GYB003]|uniref:hypothetical protein n=1 Tax=Paenibacillus sp. GYB003 TaxID=2994392 RepID=UPI002F96CA9E